MNFVIKDEIEPDTSPHYEIVQDPGVPDDPVVQNLLSEQEMTCSLQQCSASYRVRGFGW